MVVFLTILWMIPFASIGLAPKKSGWMGFYDEKKSMTENGVIAQKTDHRPSLDFSTLRAVVEKTAALMIHPPQIESPVNVIQIESSAAAFQKAEHSIGEILSKNHHPYVEAVEAERIHMIIILKSNEWLDLSGKLMEAAEKDGFLYCGPNATRTQKGADTMVAEIEILRKK